MDVSRLAAVVFARFFVPIGEVDKLIQLNFSMIYAM